MQLILKQTLATDVTDSKKILKNVAFWFISIMMQIYNAFSMTLGLMELDYG